MGATSVTGVSGPTNNDNHDRTLIRDGQIKINYDDQFPGYAERKIVPGSGMTFSVTNVDGDQKLVIAAIGGGTGDKFYQHDQVVPATTWVVNHNLDKFPAVTAVDSGNTMVMGDVTYINNNQLVIIFTSAFGGKAYMN